MEEHAIRVTLTRLINVFAKARCFVAATNGSSPQQNDEHSRSTFSSTFLRKSRTKPWKVEQTFMNFKLARNAVCKCPIFAHVDNVYANIPLTKPPTDAKQRLSANGYRSPNQKGRCPLFCCTRLLRSVMQRRLGSYAGALWQPCNAATLALSNWIFWSKIDTIMCLSWFL